MKRSTSLTIYSMLTCFGVLGACTTFSVKTNLAADCALQAAAISQATSMIGKLTTYERDAIDADIALSVVHCNGQMPNDPVPGMKVVEAATAHIGAILGVAALRK